MTRIFINRKREAQILLVVILRAYPRPVALIRTQQPPVIHRRLQNQQLKTSELNFIFL